MAEAQPSIEDRISASMNPVEPEAIAEPVAAPEPAPEIATENVEAATDPVVAAADNDTLSEPVETEAVETKTEQKPVEEEAISLSSVNDLAEHLGIDVGEIYNLAIPVTTPDGERSEVTLSEWKDSFQNSQRAEKINREAQDLQEKLTARQAELDEAFEHQNHQAAQMLNAAEQHLIGEFNNVNWDELQKADPGQWAAHRQSFAERKSQLEQIRNQAANAYEQRKGEMSKVHHEERTKVIEREHEAMLLSIPEWKNEDVRMSEQGQLRDYLTDAGYSSDEVNSAYDHRAILMARKAMLWDKSQKAAGAAKKRVVKIGSKVLKPGAKQTKAQQEQDAESEIRARLRKTGDPEDAALLIQRRLGR